MGRSAKVLAPLERWMRILEIGAGYAPIAPKAAGWKTWTVDRVTREELQAMYASEDVDVSRIEDVDVIWASGALHEAVPAELHASFDACIASHVIEHIPDLLGLFNSLELLLKPSGIISLVVPDKRFCFDFFRPLSSVGSLLEAHERQSSRHSPRTAFDDLAYSVFNQGRIAWGQEGVRACRLMHSLAEAEAAFERALVPDADSYDDHHAWQFTPSSFALALLELRALGKTGFVVERTLPTEGCQFFVTLRMTQEATPADLDSERLALLTATVRELGEQVRWLDAGARRPFAPAATVRRLGRRLISSSSTR
jgi:SAM-dependent methyltransferase